MGGFAGDVIFLNEMTVTPTYELFDVLHLGEPEPRSAAASSEGWVTYNGVPSVPLVELNARSVTDVRFMINVLACVDAVVEAPATGGAVDDVEQAMGLLARSGTWIIENPKWSIPILLGTVVGGIAIYDNQNDNGEPGTPESPYATNPSGSLPTQLHLSGEGNTVSTSEHDFAIITVSGKNNELVVTKKPPEEEKPL